MILDLAPTSRTKRSKVKICPLLPPLVLPRAAEAAFAAGGDGEVGSFSKSRVFDFVEDHLGDFFAFFYFVGGFGVEVDEDDADFAAVGGVYGAGGVEDGEAMLEGEAGLGADLAFVAVGDGHFEAGGDEDALAGLEGVVDGGIKIEAGVAFVGVGGHFYVGVEFLHRDFEF